MDIDIDFPSNFDPTKLFHTAVPASMVKQNALVKHPCGYYFQAIAQDPITQLAAIPHNCAEQFGYFKIDFLHLSLLDKFSSKTEMRQMLRNEPNWELLLDQYHVSKLFQIHKHHQLLTQVKPKSVHELADCLALIRPGKRMLLSKYLINRHDTRTQLYQQDDTGYYFKRSHAISYALTIVLQLHLIDVGRL